MTQSGWPDAFERIVRAHATALTDEDALEPQAALFDLGLDSLGMISLLVDVEVEFGVTLPQDALGAETFATPERLWNAVGAASHGE
ncbi:acyl carrier protein [Streptomyces sp. S.PNR 29]|uniref:acyl carrier protein n=1 Tax=Streptomyces sp. S.PNR 29 TaxID=2973805 RepID=UPI0025AF054D|nr:acyl carrier protein [Streptomyces sp. S.PNR 29]MDN0193989.1 acyl carrier protein [Streptomyces sp. S.PNR 29]